MPPKSCMINVMADIIGLDDTYFGDRLNDGATWQRFMDEVLRWMETIEDERIRELLNRIDTDEFTRWIDDPGLWSAINDEIRRRLNVLKTVVPSKHQGHCLN
jgi:hypothetical protein